MDHAALLRLALGQNLLAGVEVCLNLLDLRQVTLQDWQNLRCEAFHRRVLGRFGFFLKCRNIFFVIVDHQLDVRLVERFSREHLQMDR